MRRTRKLCRCGRGDILCGNEAQYNARSAEDNEPICPECKTEELIAKIRSNFKAGNER